MDGLDLPKGHLNRCMRGLHLHIHVCALSKYFKRAFKYILVLKGLSLLIFTIHNCRIELLHYQKNLILTDSKMYVNIKHKYIFIFNHHKIDYISLIVF